jgi:hypothetical protein
MPKVTITFNLPEEHKDLDYALKGLDFGLVIWRMYQLLLEEETWDTQKAIGLLNQAMEMYNVTHEDLPD